MEKLKPKLFSVMKSYTKEQFVKDVIAGIIVAIIALPLSIALALASGVTPEKGIYTAITAGFVISFLGGSRVQIAGPTAAFATIVAGIVAKNGMDGLIIATLLAGVILILMGLFRLGNLIKFIPYTITTGFTSGIAVTILIGQIKDFLGLTIVSEEPLVETMDKLKAVFQFISTTNLQALLVGVISLLILIVWQYLPGFCKKIPPSLIAVLVGSAMVALLNMNVNTIGDLYEISNKLPTISLPSFSLKTVQNVLPDAFTIAILAAIESLLSCVVADSMVNSRHRSNMEVIPLALDGLVRLEHGSRLRVLDAHFDARLHDLVDDDGVHALFLQIRPHGDEQQVERVVHAERMQQPRPAGREDTAAALFQRLGDARRRDAEGD